MRRRLRPPCPACATADARSQAAGDLLAASLKIREVGQALRERHGLCYPHLRDLLPGLRPAADTVCAAIEDKGPVAAAGTDPDAEHRSRLFSRVSGHLDPVELPPAGRLVAELDAGSCPCCCRPPGAGPYAEPGPPVRSLAHRGIGVPSAHERGPAARGPQRDAVVGHDPRYGRRRLAGQQFDVLGSGSGTRTGRPSSCALRNTTARETPNARAQTYRCRSRSRERSGRLIELGISHRQAAWAPRKASSRSRDRWRLFRG